MKSSPKIEDQKYLKGPVYFIVKTFQGKLFVFRCLVIFLKMLKKYLSELVSYEKS